METEKNRNWKERGESVCGSRVSTISGCPVEKNENTHKLKPAYTFLIFVCFPILSLSFSLVFVFNFIQREWMTPTLLLLHHPPCQHTSTTTIIDYPNQKPFSILSPFPSFSIPSHSWLLLLLLLLLLSTTTSTKYPQILSSLPFQPHTTPSNRPCTILSHLPPFPNQFTLRPSPPQF